MAATDIFGRVPNEIGGVFTADHARLTAADFPAGLLIQNFTATYNRPVNRIYEVGSPNFYFIDGRPQGRMMMQRVIGPSNLVTDFYEKFGNICNIRNNHLTFTLTEKDCSRPDVQGKTVLQLKWCVLTDMALGVTANDMIITDNSALMFGTIMKG